jgi:ribosomal protein S18 acetylase RimI-like enzyme
VAYISNLAVDASQRKCGVGSRLLRAAEAVCSSWGYDEVYLHAASADSGLLDFYARQRYTALPEMDAPAWVLAISGREATRYHVRRLDTQPVERLAAAADAMKAARPRRGKRE